MLYKMYIVLLFYIEANYIGTLHRKLKQGKQTCPGFFLKSLLESHGNLLEICLIRFVDTL